MSSAEVGSSSTMNFGSSTISARHRDALALAAGKLMRIAKARFRIETDILQRLHHQRLALAFGDMSG